RFAASDISEDRRSGTGADELVVVLLRSHPGPLGAVNDLVTELVVGDLDVLRFSQRVQHELDLDALLRGFLQLGVQLLLGLLLSGEVVLKRGAQPLQLVDQGLLADRKSTRLNS